MIGEERTKEMRRLYDVEKMTLRDIADRFEVSPERVRQLLHADGYIPRPGGFQRTRPIPGPCDYEMKVTRIQTKSVVVSAISKWEAKNKALLQVKWDDGLPMRTTYKISRPVEITDE